MLITKQAIEEVNTEIKVNTLLDYNIFNFELTIKIQYIQRELFKTIINLYRLMLLNDNNLHFVT